MSNSLASRRGGRGISLIVELGAGGVKHSICPWVKELDPCITFSYKAICPGKREAVERSPAVSGSFAALRMTGFCLLRSLSARQAEAEDGVYVYGVVAAEDGAEAPVG